MSRKSRKIFIMVSVLVGFFILGLLGGVFAATSDNNYCEWRSPLGDILWVKYWSSIWLNSFTNSFGGIPGNFSAVTTNTGKMENVAYNGNLDFGLFVGSDWDNTPGMPIDWWQCANSPKGVVDDHRGDDLDVGESDSWQMNLTNTHNFGQLGVHWFAAFATSMDYGGKGTQCKSWFRTQLGP